jgi:hypothetical protein
MYRLLLIALLWTAAAVPTAAQVFLPDDPLPVDPDTLDVPMPEPVELSVYYDYVENALLRRGETGGRALNANTLGEVPNSSWYTNRHYHKRMSTAALVRGPNRLGGPEPGPWTVLSGKAEGKAIGFTIADTTGAVFLFKLDPPGHLGMTTGAELVSTKLFHALGYHVPENYVVTFRPDRLVIGEGAEAGGDPLTEVDLRDLLAQVPQTEEGAYRALASRFIEGEPLGPFRYWGRRPDDPNDLFPHEHRRELRGLRAFAAWLQHTDARAHNTLDTYVERAHTDTEGSRDTVRYVRHHLLDFGSTLGAGAVDSKRLGAGHERNFSPGVVLTSALTLGFAGRPWLDIDYVERPALGRFTAEGFDPARWTPQYRNPAFANMDTDDAFWAARQIAHFTDEEIRAVTAAARYPDPQDARLLADILVERRDRIARAWLGHGGGLDRFEVRADSLAFDDLLSRHGLASAPARTATWYDFDNATGRRGTQIGDAAVVTGEAVRIPTADVPFLAAVLRTEGRGATEVVLRRDAGGWRPVGVRRTSED